MSQIPSLISDLAVILISAGLVTLLFKKLKQPVVLGYIVAGLLAGPSITQIPTVTNVESIRIWADIGVIFLLFALGLDFSFKKLMKVGGTAVIGAITIVIGMMTLGYTTGLSLGWGHMNSLFLGGMLSMSSTTIIFKAFDDMGLRNQRFAGVVFGILVVEDLVCRFTDGFTVYIGSQQTRGRNGVAQQRGQTGSFSAVLFRYRHLSDSLFSEKSQDFPE